MIVFSGSRSTALGWEVCKLLRTELGRSEISPFPDGELYVRVHTPVRGQECAVIQSTRTNNDFMELLITLDLLRDLGANQVHVVIPYMGYMRQDKRFQEGEALSAKTMLKLVHELADTISVINCHFLDGPGFVYYEGVHMNNMDAIPLLAEYFRGKVSKPIFIAPDKGSLAYAKDAAKQLDCEFDHLQKTRLSGSEVVIKDKKLDVKGMDVIMLDDIISTGGTIAEAAKVIRGWRPASVNVGCVHGIFLNGTGMFQGVTEKLVSTNTLENPASKVSVAALIAMELKR